MEQNTLQHALQCTLQHTATKLCEQEKLPKGAAATHCNTLQHTATLNEIHTATKRSKGKKNCE